MTFHKPLAGLPRSNFSPQGKPESKPLVLDQVAYANEEPDNGVTSLDISDPTSVQKADSITSPDLDQGDFADVDGEYLYVPSRGGDCLTIVDISDPANLSISATINTSQIVKPHSVHVVGNYAYVGMHEYVTIIDISDPTNPTQVGYANDAELWDTMQIYKQGDYVFTASNGAFAGPCMTVVDVSTPSNPTVETTLSFNNWPSVITGGTDYVYLASTDSYFQNGVKVEEISVVDISTPTNPTQEATIASSDITEPLEIRLDGSYLYLTSSSGLTIFDVSTPTNPSQVGTTPTFDGYGFDLFQSYAFASSANPDSLKTIDKTDKTDPTIENSYSMNHTAWSINVVDYT